MIRRCRLFRAQSAFMPGADAHNCHLPQNTKFSFWELHDIAARNDVARDKKGFHYLPKLPYDVDAGVAPLMSPLQLKTHLYRYHQEYVDTLNEHTLGTVFEAQPLDVIIRKTIGDATQATVYQAASQHFNHSFFWHSIIPNGSVMPQAFKTAIVRQFGSVNDLLSAFRNAAMSLHGSGGWVYLVWKDGVRFDIVAIPEPGGNVLAMDYVPLVALDMWEHAYLKDYEMHPMKYVDNYFQAVNWKVASRNWERATGALTPTGF